MNSFYLLIDDQRSFEKMDGIARTAKDGKEQLLNNSVTHLVLDNDLGEEYEGVDILKWAIENNCVPPNIYLITSNVVAKRRMEDILYYELHYKFIEQWWRKVE